MSVNMYREIVNKGEYIKIPALKKLSDSGLKRGDAVYLLLKGAVRKFSGITITNLLIYSKLNIITIIVLSLNTKGQMDYECDHCPGDCFGEEGNYILFRLFIIIIIIYYKVYLVFKVTT